MRHWIRRISLITTLGLGVYFCLSHFYVTPVLMYHHIDHRANQWKLSVSPQNFRRQMEFLKAHRYNVLSLEDYIRMLKDKERVPKKSVVITFDDGYDNNFTHAYPILKKLNLPATIFIQADGINRQGYMTHEDISILIENGIDIGSHTMNHGFLPNLDDEAMLKEIKGSKDYLEKRFRIPITTFSYPGGGFTDKARQMTMDAGYWGAAATHPGAHYPDKDPYALKRIRISRTADNLFVFWIKTSGFYTYIEEFRG